MRPRPTPRYDILVKFSPSRTQHLVSPAQFSYLNNVHCESRNEQGKNRWFAVRRKIRPCLECGLPPAELLPFVPIVLARSRQSGRDRPSQRSPRRQSVRSPSFELRLPSVISLKEYVPQRASRPSPGSIVFLRDRFACQYCGIALPSHELTFDHVIPRLKGDRRHGNVVTACAPCTEEGGQMPNSPATTPKRKPVQPTVWHAGELPHVPAELPARELQHDFLYWDAELKRTQNRVESQMAARDPAFTKAERTG